MVKINFLEVPAELQEKYNKIVTPNDTFYNSRIIRKNSLLSRPRKSSVKIRSYLAQMKLLWASFTLEQKALWSDTRPYNGLTGYCAFVQEQSQRIKLGFEGNAVPSTLHNGKCGFIILTWPDCELKLFQPHPNRYWTKKKKAGTKGQYELLEVDEILTLPLEIALSYKAELTEIDTDYEALFYVIIASNYQGRNIETKIKIDLDLQTDWKRGTIINNHVLGQVRSYSAYLHLRNVVGVLKFDNIVMSHSGQNYARDKRCNNIAQTFTRQYFNVPKHWVAEYEGENTTHYSDYHEVEI